MKTYLNDSPCVTTRERIGGDKHFSECHTEQVHTLYARCLATKPFDLDCDILYEQKMKRLQLSLPLKCSSEYSLLYSSSTRQLLWCNVEGKESGYGWLEGQKASAITFYHSCLLTLTFWVCLDTFPGTGGVITQSCNVCVERWFNVISASILRQPSHSQLTAVCVCLLRCISRDLECYWCNVRVDWVN